MLSPTKIIIQWPNQSNTMLFVLNLNQAEQKKQSLFFKLTLSQAKTKHETYYYKSAELFLHNIH